MVANQSNEPITVLFVDDNRDMTTMFSLACSREADITCVGTLGAADGMLETVQRLKPRVVVLDLTMPGEDPLEVLGELQRESPDTRVIVFSGYDDQDTIDQAIEAGAWGFISKHQDTRAVFHAIRQVAAGVTVLGP